MYLLQALEDRIEHRRKVRRWKGDSQDFKATVFNSIRLQY